MKKNYVILLFTLLISGANQAQLTLTKATHEPSVGDVNRVRGYDSVSVIPKSTGSAKLWDFSNLAMNSNSETITYVTVVSTPSAGLFPSATIADVRSSGGGGGNDYEYNQSVGTKYEFWGDQKPSNNQSFVFSNSATWMDWPIAMNSNISDSFTAIETTTAGNTNYNGVITYTATGSGTVVMPGGNILTNCLQIIRAIVISVTSGTVTANLTIRSYEYYTGAIKFPIINVQYNTLTSGTVSSTDFHIDVNIDALSVGIKEELSDISQLTLYPNPANNTIQVSLPGSAVPTSIEVFDLNGKLVATVNNSTSIDVSTLGNALYTVRVKNKGLVTQKAVSIFH